MSDITYKIVKAPTLSKLEDKVNEHLKEGWTLRDYSTVIVENGLYHKEMYKYDTNSPKKLLKG